MQTATQAKRFLSVPPVGRASQGVSWGRLPQALGKGVSALTLGEGCWY